MSRDGSKLKGFNSWVTNRQITDWKDEIESLKAQLKAKSEEVERLKDRLKKANKATTILVGSEYHDSPDVVINELETMVRSFQESMQKSISKSKAYKTEVEKLKQEIKDIKSSVTRFTPMNTPDDWD